MYKPPTITAREMKLGDIVVPKQDDSFPREFSFCVVRQIGDELITLFRPYIPYASYSLADQKRYNPYIGIEEYPIYVESSAEYYLMRRKEKA